MVADFLARENHDMNTKFVAEENVVTFALLTENS
jgi:hypothetical protein